MPPMQSWRATYKSASAMIHEFGDGRATVINVFAEVRRQGHATRMMQDICDYMDRNNLILIIEAREYGQPQGPNNKQLKAWYESFGAKVVDISKPFYLERLPNSQEKQGL